MCGGSSFDSFQVDFLEAHNAYREKHGSPRIELDKGLCNFAQQYANYMATCDVLGPSKNRGFGENIFFKCSDRKIYPDAIEPVASWYDEGKCFSANNVYPSKDIKHFAQVIWKSTRVLGVGYALNRDETKLYVVANYYPPGNDFESFCDNVKPLRKSHTDKKKCPTLVRVV